jgi:hypothetical protein
MQLAPPTPFHDLCPFVLGHHPLDLQQQTVLGTIPNAVIQEHHLNGAPTELVDQQH